MDYLRTIGSALVQKSGLNLPFSLGPKVALFEGISNLYDGTKRDDGSPVSIFEYDFNDPSKKNSMAMAKNALRKLRSTRHPDVLKFMDAVETDSTIYIMTERVRTLTATLQTWQSRGAQEREDWLLWGLHRISVALAFINDSCSSTHGNICINSVFISPSGEWKLGGFEVFSSPKDDAAVLYTMGGMLPEALSWASPEVKKCGWPMLKQCNTAAADAYALGLLLHATFNPTQPFPVTAQPPHPPPPPSSRGYIPTSVFPAYKKLLNPNPKTRLTPKSFLEIGMADTGFFANNRLVKVCLGLDNFSLGSEAEKNSLLRTLKESAASFPSEFTSYRVLPSIISALEYGGASAVAILPLVLQFGKNVSPEEYPTIILAPLIKLFASPDRGTRMALLEHLPEFVEQLDKKMVTEQIWPHLQTGFTDTVAVIREATIKSIILLSPKLGDRILNNDLLRYLSKMQMDSEASIRTNTCILIGRLGPLLGYNTKRKVLVPAFSRALKDPFVHARVAGLMAFMATIDCFEIEDLASKVIPNMSFAMLDKEKLVRDQAFKAVELFVRKLEGHAATMPETAIPEATNTHGVPMPAQATLVNSAAGAAGALAGWAISSMGKKLAAADMQSTMSSVQGASLECQTSAPPPAGEAFPDNRSSLHQSPLLTIPTTLSATNSTSSSPTIPTGSTRAPFVSRTKGMQLGANKVPGGVAAAVLAAELANDAATTEADSNPWGSDDLIDVNADQDDWSAFESGLPVVVEPNPSPSVGNKIGNGRISPHQREGSWGAVVDVSDVPADIDPWNGPNAQPTYPMHSIRSLTVHPLQRNTTPSASSSHRSTPASSPRLPESNDWDSKGGWDPVEKEVPTSAALSVAGMNKEEKAAQMARRKAERKQRIAHLKEQKKSATPSKP